MIVNARILVHSKEVGDAAVGWTFLSNHAHVLVVVARTPDLRVREIAEQVGITERATLRILAELEEAGVITRERLGRCTQYRIHGEAPLRHPLEARHCVGELVQWLGPIEPPRRRKRA